MALVYLHKVNPILLDEETKYPDELTTPSDSPFMLAMLQNVGNVVKDIGKSNLTFKLVERFLLFFAAIWLRLKEDLTVVTIW